MKQKYAITKDGKTDQIRIQEFAELDKDSFSLVCEETYDRKKIKAAAAEGKEPLIQVLRTPNLYPASEYADKIAESVKNLFFQSDQDSVELEFDDIEALRSEKETAESGDDSIALDELLEDEIEDKDDSSEDGSEDSEDEEDSTDDAPFSDEDSLDVLDDDDNDDVS